MGRLDVGKREMAFWRTKAAISLKRVKMEEKLLWRNSKTLFRTVPLPTPHGLLFLKIEGLHIPLLSQEQVKLYGLQCSSFLFLKFMAAIIQPHCSLSILHFKKTKSDSILIDCRVLWGHMNMIPLPNARSTGALVASTASCLHSYLM